MSVDLFTIWVTAVILLVTGYSFFSDLSRALRRRAQKAELRRQVEAITKLDENMKTRL